MNPENSQNRKEHSANEGSAVSAACFMADEGTSDHAFKAEGFTSCSEFLPVLDNHQTFSDSEGNIQTESPSCSACPLKDCPTRGMIEEKMAEILAAEESNPLSPAQMIAASGRVFVFPLICAVLGIYGMNALQIEKLSEEVSSVLGAAAGFFAGLVLVQFVLIFKRFSNGQ